MLHNKNTESIHHTDKYIQHHSHLTSLTSWVFVYEVSGCEFEFLYSHLNFRYSACFGLRVPWVSDNFRVWIHFKHLCDMIKRHIKLPWRIHKIKSKTKYWKTKNCQKLQQIKLIFPGQFFIYEDQWIIFW